jgi:hypothetical protein
LHHMLQATISGPTSGRGGNIAMAGASLTEGLGSGVSG